MVPVLESLRDVVIEAGVNIGECSSSGWIPSEQSIYTFARHATNDS